MTAVQLTRHAVARLAQRAIRDEDIALIMMIGTEVRDGYIVLERDCQAAERELKRLLDQIRRLNGKRLVAQGGQIVTGYHAGLATKRRLVRSAEDRELTA
jgi:hypothetical protein